MGTSPSPILQVPGTLSLVVKQPGHVADHSPPPCVEVKNEAEPLHAPYLHGMHSDNFTFTYTAQKTVI